MIVNIDQAPDTEPGAALSPPSVRPLAGLTVLVTDAETRAALATIRSLGRAGSRVVACSPEDHSLGGASRYCARHIRTQSSLAHPVAYVADVRQICEDESVDVLLPMTDAALTAILPQHDMFEPTVIPFPDFERYNRASDKAHLLRLARQLGFYVPDQVVLEAPDYAPTAIEFPVILKPSRSLVAASQRQRKTAVVRARNTSEYVDSLRQIPSEAYPVLRQRVIQGHGAGVFLIRWAGTTDAVFGHRRLREKPPSGGVSVFRASWLPPADLVARCERLLQALDWEGPAMIEFRVEEETGIPYLMEINARFWGSLQLAIDAGVDFPARLVSLAVGRKPTVPPAYRANVRSRWLLGDLDHLMQRLRYSREHLNLPLEAPGRLSAVWAFLRGFGPDVRDEVLDLSDPAPAIREAKRWLSTLRHG